MAWYKRYRVPFQSFNGTQYMVYVYEQVSGTLVTLKGSDEPFETSEDDSDDIFTPIRPQTGYLRVVDETANGNLMETMMPINNTEKMVCLYTGTWDADFTTFTDGSLKWQGFLCAEAFTQPWDKQTKVVEFSVKSVLAAMEDVFLPESAAGNTMRTGKLIEQGLEQLGASFATVAVVSNLYNPMASLIPFVRNAVFYSEDNINNQGNSYQQIIGSSYYEALESVLSLYGIQLREDGDRLSLCVYDKSDNDLHYTTLTWSAFMQYINDGYGAVFLNTLPDTAMLPALTFRGEDNVLGFVQGGRNAIVSLDVDDKLSLHINLPQTTEDDSTVYSVDDLHEGHVFVQPHAPRSNGIETFSFSEYNFDGSAASRVGPSSYQDCLENTVIYWPKYDPHNTDGDNLHTGAFPCRWYFQQSESEAPVLKNGLFLNQQYRSSGFTFTPYLCYSIESSLSFKLKDGYLNINLQCDNFRLVSVFPFLVDTLFFADQMATGETQATFTQLYVGLTFGDKMWNGTAWESYTGYLQPFTIDVEGNRVKTNKTSSMTVDESTGWFIPVTSEMAGKVTLYILNYASTEIPGDRYFNAHSRIISDLTVEFFQNAGLTASRRSQNTYRETILSSGFSEDKEIQLSIGTMNNNVESSSFIKNDDDVFIEQCYYKTATGSKGERPELNLLRRMVAQYGQVRRTLKAVIQSGIEMILTRYTYDSKAFFAVDSQHKWRDDEQEVKFIEVT
jgi:hypothetical protein